MHPAAGVPLALVAASLGLAAGCGDTPVAPSDPTVASIEISGPTTVPLGGTAQFTATVHLKDGSTQNATAAAIWSSGWPVVASVDAGLATGRQTGEAVIVANFMSRSDSHEVIVTPAGTYRLTGSVIDPVFPTRPPRVTVEATGPDGVTQATTQDDRGFRFYGLAGRVRLRVDARLAYLEPLEEELDLSDHRSVTLMLPVKDPGADVSGQYNLSIAADPGCHALPADALRRSYLAHVTQRATIVSVRLGGASFAESNFLRHDFLDGSVVDGRFRLYLLEWLDTDPSYPGLFEVLSPGRFYTAYGLADLTGTASGFSGLLDGTLSVTGEGATGSCRATGHVLTISR